MTGLRKILAIGAGVGIEIGARDLRVCAVRVRPNGVRLLGLAEIREFRERPAAEWGAELQEFLRKSGANHLSVTALLPRRDVIVRQVQMPGVSRRDLDAAIRLQLDSLHPYPEEEALYGWARVGGTATVLVGIVRSEIVSQFSELFREVGVKLAGLTLSAAAIHSAARLFGPARGEVLAIYRPAEPENESYELYGESAARPVFSADFDLPVDRVLALAASELRLQGEVEPVALSALMPPIRKKPAGEEISEETLERFALAYATALTAACPRLGLGVNLLPEEQRSSPSRLIYAPTAALAAVAALLALALPVQQKIEERRYLAALEHEIAQLAPEARQLEQIQRKIDETRARARMLDEYRLRTKADLDALQEVTKLLAPPNWLNSFELTRSSVNLGGEAEQAAGLLKALDESPLFADSEFTMALARLGQFESFRIRASRTQGGAE